MHNVNNLADNTLHTLVVNERDHYHRYATDNANSSCCKDEAGSSRFSRSAEVHLESATLWFAYCSVIIKIEFICTC